MKIERMEIIRPRVTIARDLLWHIWTSVLCSHFRSPWHLVKNTLNSK